MDNKVKEEMDEVIAELQKFTSRILDWREPVNPVLTSSLFCAII